MDKQFYKYFISNVRWTKCSCDVVYWFVVGFLACLLSEFYFTMEMCKNIEAETLANSSIGINFTGIYQFSTCSMEASLKSWAAAWFICTLIRIPFLLRQSGPILKMMGVYLTRFDGKRWDLKTALLYGFIEWLPVHLGAVYVFFIGFPISVFSIGVYTTIVLGAQFLWLSPVFFRFKDRNLAEILSSVTVDATESEYRKIEGGYSNKLRLNINNFFIGFSCLFYFVISWAFVFSAAQLLRIPEQNPAYQEALYGGYDPIWEENMYFAMEGISAPANVSNFYEYGLNKAYVNFMAFEGMKRHSGIDKNYLYKEPNFEGFSVVLDKEHEIDINDYEWKNLDCLYDLEAQNDDQCASFSDWKSYIEQNKILWDRFNQVPDLGDVYVTPPQFLGGKIKHLIQLAELKAVHIIYLAENGRQNESMREWLRYMRLYTTMAGNRETMIFKAFLATIIVRQVTVLERLLIISPAVASTYQHEILYALKNEEPIFRDAHMITDDLGLMEPFYYGAMGNASAVRNDFFKCLQDYQAAAERPLSEFPDDDEEMALCPLHEDRSNVEKLFVYPATTPGNYIVNTLYGLLYSNALTRRELIKKTKTIQVMFRQAQLAVTILAQNIAAHEIGLYVKKAPTSLHNPIAKEPFHWSVDYSRISFDTPDKKVKHNFHLNLVNSG